jgi:putative flippase GtrA
VTAPVVTNVPVVDVDARVASIVLDVVVPVHNEEADLARCVERLHAHLTDGFPYTFRIVVADNASTDATLEIARSLARRLPHVDVVHLAEKGRGRALRAVWATSPATVLAYTDVDLSTDLNALFPLVAPLLSGHSDLAIGSRLRRGARVVRGARREIVSRGYNLILRGTLAARFSDAQCGFKAIRRDVAVHLLPLIEDNDWFFDTELLVIAERSGLRIHEVPVDWVDDPDSRVDLIATAMADLRGVARLARGVWTGRLPVADVRAQLGRHPLDPRVEGVPVGLVRQAVRFAAVGLASTLAYVLLYLGLRWELSAQAANLIALGATALANTAVNRRFTFGVRGRAGVATHQAQGLLVFGVGLTLTSGALWTVRAVESTPSRPAELIALVAANAMATAVRFVLLRQWVFRKPGGTTTSSSRPPARPLRRRTRGDRPT